MPKVVYTPAKGLVQQTGTGFEISNVAIAASTSSGVTCDGFFAGFIPNAVSETKTTAGAVSVAAYQSFIGTAAGALDMSLASGTAAGQLKKIMMHTDAGTNVTLTLTAAAGFNTVVFSNVGDTVDLLWTGTSWRILGAYNVAAGNIATPALSTV
jgi:hypothetical protein